MNSTHIDYLELGTADIAKTKAFFSSVFAWQFQDFGEEYSAWSKESAGVNGGLFQATTASRQKNGGALIVLYTTNLESTQQAVIAGGGTIVKEVFAFPGGRRFHFLEPCGNEFAVWSDT